MLTMHPTSIGFYQTIITYYPEGSEGSSTDSHFTLLIWNEFNVIAILNVFK